jgi:hypothetical protein
MERAKKINERKGENIDEQQRDDDNTIRSVCRMRTIIVIE